MSTSQKKPDMNRPYEFKEKVGKSLGRFGITIIRFRNLMLLLILLGVGLLSYNIPKLSIATSLESSFKGHNQAIQDYHEFRDLFGRDDKIVILINSEDIFSPHFLARLKEFHQDLENTLPMVSEVDSLINAKYIEGKEGVLQVNNFMEELPQSKEQAETLRQKALSYPLYRNSYLSQNGDALIMVVKTQAVSALTEDGKRIRNHGRGFGGEEVIPTDTPLKSISQVENIAVLGIIETVIKQYNAENFSIVFSGTPAYQFHVEPKIRKSMIYLSIMVLALTFFFMAVLFGRVSGIFLPQFVVLMSLAATLGLMALTGVPFTLTSSMLPSIILSVGLTPPLHFMVVFFKYQKKVGRLRAVIRTLEHSGLPIIMTGLTTIIGLLSFSFTDIAPIADLGIFAAIGIGICLLLTLVFLPALLALLKILPGSEREKLYETSTYNRMLIWMGRTGIRHAHDIYILSFIVFIAILPGFFKFNFSHNMLHYFDEEERFIQETRLIEDETSGFRALEVVVDTGEKNGILDRKFLYNLEQLEDYALEQNNISGRPYTGKITSILDIVKETNQAWHGGDRAYHTIPPDDFLVEKQLAEFRQISPDYLGNFTDQDFSLARFTAMMYWKDAAMDVDFVKQLKEYAAELFGGSARVLVTGAVSIGSRVIDSMMSNLAIGYFTAFFIITLFMIIAVGDLKLGLVAMIPNLFPIIAGLGLMGLMGIPLNTYNLIGGSIVIGVAVDDTIHFFHNFRHYFKKTGDVETAVVETLRSAGRALITTTLILVSCFWLRLFSSLKVISDFGLIVGFSLLVAFLADVMLAPALLNYLYGSKAGKEQQAAAGSSSKEAA
ncbi:MAG: MMPL family transporter [Desulfobulbales bacterium]